MGFRVSSEGGQRSLQVQIPFPFIQRLPVWSSWAERSPVQARDWMNLVKKQFALSMKVIALSFKEDEHCVHITALKCAWRKHNIILTNIFYMRFTLKHVEMLPSNCQQPRGSGENPAELLWICVRGWHWLPVRRQVQGWLGSPWGELPPAPHNWLCAEHNTLISPFMDTAQAECQLYFRVCQLEFLC